MVEETGMIILMVHIYISDEIPQ